MARVLLTGAGGNLSKILRQPLAGCYDTLRLSDVLPLADLVQKVVSADRVGFSVVYGVSDNQERWWENRHASFLGWRPQNSSTIFLT